ncbi:MAG TPA: aldolase/citrate lyase family protein [Vicinamibacterales bacterium]|nr:aldolase/citrate lyase family protein [Vicinamibacterales bacterium]
MRASAFALAAAGLAAGSLSIGVVHAQHRQRMNPVIELLEQKKPVFGVYWPSNPQGRRGAPPPADLAPKPPAELAREALAYHASDFLFNGSMEGGIDRAIGSVSDFIKATADAGALTKTPFSRFPHPLIVKIPKIAPGTANANENISRALNLGVSGIMFVEVESAAEVRAGLNAMRFASNGGTRPDAVGTAPSYWGMSEQEYTRKADLWPLNPDGELLNWTIVESKEGLAHVREIAAVKGIGVLWPGAGTLRGVFTTTSASGERVFDQAGWENAIQTVLSACKEFNVPCGFPATPNDIEMRMKQGFSVFVMNWGDAGFKAVELGRAAAGRSPTQ